MMLDHWGHPEASEELLAAAFGALADGAGYTRAVLDRVGC